jgi:transcriptional regulator with XRE-family HTH domain
VNERQRRIARARLLRRQGKTYSEIRDLIGPVDDKTLQIWCRGIPRPRETYRSHPRDDVRRECRRLRAEGWTISEIAEKTGASKGSVSPWVRDVKPRTRERAELRRLAGLRAAAKTNAERFARFREVQQRVAAVSIGPLTERELFLVGVGLYWAEGSKSKTYAIRERIAFINSDPTMITAFMSWLTLLGVRLDDCRFRLQIHETADVVAAEEYWAELVGVARDAFSRTTLKRHRPLTKRKNVAADYRGCLVISVVQSAVLYRCVAGWWEGIHAQTTRNPRAPVAWEGAPPWRFWSFFRRRLSE